MTWLCRRAGNAANLQPVPFGGERQRAFNVHFPDKRVIAKGGDGRAVKHVSHLIQTRIVRKSAVSEIADEDIIRIQPGQFVLMNVEFAHVLLYALKPFLRVAGTHQQ
jgi:hypothetical protein